LRWSGVRRPRLRGPTLRVGKPRRLLVARTACAALLVETGLLLRDSRRAAAGCTTSRDRRLLILETELHSEAGRQRCP